MNLASLFNLEEPDLFVILVIVLLLFGAKTCRFARLFGEAQQKFRKALNELGESQDESDRTPRPVNLFNVVASVLVFVALAVFLLALASR